MWDEKEGKNVHKQQKEHRMSTQALGAADSFDSFNELIQEAMKHCHNRPTEAAKTAVEWLRNKPDLFDQFAAPILYQACYNQTLLVQGRARHSILNKVPPRQRAQDMSKQDKPSSSASSPPEPAVGEEALTPDKATSSPIASNASGQQAYHKALLAHGKQLEVMNAYDRVLLNYPMSTGKSLRFATREEIIYDANRLFSQAKTMIIRRNWLNLIAKALPDDTKRVEDVLNEQKLQELYRRAEKQALK
jgi:hypothetical protein